MRRTILLADDSPTIQRLVTNTFADGEFDIVSVSNGEAAIRKFEEIRPNVVLADIYMPGKNGYEVCAYVRHHPSLGGTPVVLLVGAFDAFDDDKAKEAGATSNITKPFEPRALISLVESILPEVHQRTAAPESVKVVINPVESQVPTLEPKIEAVRPPEMAVPDDDLLGLENLFVQPAQSTSPALSEQDIERIADRVIQRISRQVIENLAWEVLPDLAERIVREELQRKR